MDYISIFRDIAAAMINKLAFPKPGRVVEFNSQYKIAKVETSSGRGTDMSVYECPWILDTAGVYAPDPEIGTMVILGFIGGNSDKAFILSAYDPFWSTGRKQSLVRNKATYSTRVDKSFL